MHLLIRPNSGSQKVFANIRLFATCIVLFALLLSGFVSAQSPTVDAPVAQQANPTVNSTQAQNDSQTNAQTETKNTAKPSEQAVSARPISNTNQSPILRLEDTIRGNKEQPQVLTIVPWQLPIHQRINENSEWQLQVNQLSSIERGAFLRELAVVNELTRTQANVAKPNEAAADSN